MNLKLRRVIESESKATKTFLRYVKSGVWIDLDLKELNKIIIKPNIYTEGNLSQYILYAALNFIPGKEDFDEDK